MSKIVFELQSGIDGEVQLRDGLFMDFWKFAFTRNKKLLGVRQDKILRQAYGVTPEEHWNWIERNLYDTTAHIRLGHVKVVNEAIDNLKKAGYSWSLGYMPNEPTCEDCNRIHRGFTTYMLTGCSDTINLDFDQKQSLKYTMDNFNTGAKYYLIRYLDPSLLDTLRIPQGETGSYLHWAEHAIPHLELINSYVHKIEDDCIKQTKEFVQFNSYIQQHHPQYKFLTTPDLDWNSKMADGCTDAERCDFNFERIRHDDPTMYSSSPEFNVYDLKNILGKDYTKAWYDNDDPVELDICNTYNTTKGGFEIKPHQSHLTRNFLKPWIESYGIGYDDRWIAPIAIGTVSDSWLHEHCFFKEADFADFDNMLLNGIKKVDLIE